MANAVYLVVYDILGVGRQPSGVDKVFVGENKEAKRQALEYARAKESRSRNRLYTAVKAKSPVFVNETTIGP